MRLLRELKTACSKAEPSVVTVGNFDGMHRGHQALLRQVKSLAEKHHCRSILLSFDPLPQEFFSHKPPARLMRLTEKWKVLQSSNLDEVYVLRFNQALAMTSALSFVETILVGALSANYIVVGEDFRFGCKRQGDVAFLQAQAKRCGFEVITHTERDDAKTISSTWVREALQKGDFALVEKLLGRPYQNIGRVVHGSRLGRELGCPTANIPMRRKVSPVHGVYVVKVMSDNVLYYGVASVGNRPAIGGHPEVLLEVHLFDFEGDLYGKRLEVTYVHKLRDEWMFASLDALKEQIARDCQEARAICHKLYGLGA